MRKRGLVYSSVEFDARLYHIFSSYDRCTHVRIIALCMYMINWFVRMNSRFVLWPQHCTHADSSVSSQNEYATASEGICDLCRGGGIRIKTLLMRTQFVELRLRNPILRYFSPLIFERFVRYCVHRFDEIINFTPASFPQLNFSYGASSYNNFSPFSRIQPTSRTRKTTLVLRTGAFNHRQIEFSSSTYL